MEQNEKTIIGEELIKILDEQRPQVEKEVNDLLESLLKDGKYHIAVVAEVIGKSADELHVGYDNGYYSGREDMAAEICEHLKSNEDELDYAPINCVIKEIKNKFIEE